MNRSALIGLVTSCLGVAVAGAAMSSETRCWIDGGAVVVPAAYGPITGDFILDLSQSTSQLHDTAARTVGWAGDTARWTLRLAGSTRRGFPMPVANLDARIASFPTNIAGILGADVLGPFTLDLQLAPCRLSLTRVPRSPRQGREMKSKMIGGVPAVFGAISDGVSARGGWFAIDTASAGSRIADAGFSRPLPKGLDPSARRWPPARLRAVSMGGVLIEQTPAGLMNPAPPGIAGTLGLAIWSRVHLHIDGRTR